MLPEELRTRALQVAREMGISLGEMIREALLAALEQRRREGRAGDSLLRDSAVHAGRVPEDLSTRHDRYLYGEGE